MNANASEISPFLRLILHSIIFKDTMLVVDKKLVRFVYMEKYFLPTKRGIFHPVP